MKKLFKILLWSAGIFAVLVVLLIVAAKLFLPADKIRAMAVEQAVEALDRQVTIADLDVSFWGGLGVRLVDVTVASPAEFDTADLLTADNIDVKLQLFPLISGEYRVDRLIINSPVVTMRKNAAGVSNFDFPSMEEQVPDAVAEAVPDEAKAAAAVVTFDKLEINNGRVDFVDTEAGLAIHAGGLNLSTSLEVPRDNVYQSSGKISAESLMVVTEDSLPSFAVGIEYRADYDLAQSRILIHESELNVNGLAFQLNGSGSHANGAKHGRGSLHSKEISVADLFKLMPPEQMKLLEDFELDGAFSFDLDLTYDEQKEQPLDYSGSAVITDLEMAQKDIAGKLTFKRALVDFEVDNLRMNIEQGSFDGRPLTGMLTINDFDDPTVNGELAGRLNLAFIAPFLPVEENHQLAGELEFDTKFDGSMTDPADMRFSGELSVANGAYSSKLLPEPIERFSLDMFVDNSLANVRNLSLETAGGKLTFSGRVNNLVPYLMADSTVASSVTPSMDGSVEGSLNLGMLQRFLDQEAHAQLTGQITMDLRLAGSADNLANFKPHGTLSISDGSYHNDGWPEPIERLDAQLIIRPDTIDVEELKIEFQTSDMSVTGKLIDPFPYLLPLEIVDQSQVKKPNFKFDLTSHRLNIDSLFPEAVPGSGNNRASLPADSVSSVILPDINGRGSFHIDTLIYSAVEFTGIDGRVMIKDRKIVCTDVTGNAYSGGISGNTTIDLSDFEIPVYQGEFQARQIEVDDFITRFPVLPMGGGYVFGKIDMDGSFNAVGWEPEDFLNSLKMDSRLDMNEGKLRTSGATFELVNSLASKLGEEFSREQPLKNAATNLYVKDGKVGIDKLITKLGDLGDLELDGFYGIFDGSLNYNGTILLSQERSKKLMGGLGSLFGSGNTGRVKLPLSIGGTFDNPKPSLDTDAIKDNLGDNLKKEAEGLIKGLF
ncbi:MAG: AsmA family protein [candidate division Zixibacteria bacterium]|nr:AsmA family protein [candidate division Zixibacteria bacterium]MDH3935725.1 AsmA family protein [candidate division Zixibacteria bacterium]MDH4033734.1 AsmA family protein [candidate division Zixibacteria bacterium]